MRIGIIIFICVFLNLPDAGYGQLNKHNKKSDFPYQLSPAQEICLIGSGTALLYAGGRVQTTLDYMSASEVLALKTSSLLFVDRGATTNWDKSLDRTREFFEPASIVSTIGLIGGLGLSDRITGESWSVLKTLILMYLEGAYLTEGMVLLTKATIKRPRPYTYNSSLSLEQKVRSANNESFLSGNAGILFYHASFVSLIMHDMYPDRKWLPYVYAGTHGLAILSGYWSVKSGMHFPTDILAGALWGSGMALLVTHLHKKKNQSLSIHPWSGRNQTGNKISGLSLIIKPKS